MLGGILKKILGDKSATDQKKYQPVIQQVGEIFNTLQNESDDALRGRTTKFRKQVQDAIAGLEAEIADLKQKANDITMPLHQKEAIYESIDSKEKEVNVIIEKVLEDILPEAFAVVKETARRWAQNGQLSVTATEFDKEMFVIFGYWVRSDNKKFIISCMCIMTQIVVPITPKFLFARVLTRFTKFGQPTQTQIFTVINNSAFHKKMYGHEAMTF